MADFDPYAALASNPYMQAQQKPDWMSFLGNALLGVGAGISQADSSGRGIGAGIGPGLMMGANMNAQQQQQAWQHQMKAAEWQQMETYRKAQEENMRSQMAERELGMGIDRGILSQINGGGGQTAAPPGMNVQPPAYQMGPNQFNVGNVRPAGGGPNSGFQQPASFDDGVALSVRNARSYPAAFNNGQPMTLLQIGERWAPKGDGANDPVQWAKNVASIGGLPVDQPLDMSDPATAAKFARGAHGAEWGQKMLKPPEAYVPGANMAGSPRVIRVADGPQQQPQGQPQGQPQQAFNGPPGASAGIDQLSQQMLLSKRFGPLGQARITNQNQQFTQDMETRKFGYQQQEDARKAAQETANAQRSAANQDVNIDPVTGQPVVNTTAVEAKKAVSAAQGTDPSSKITLELAQDAIKRNSDWQKAGTAAGGTIRNLDLFTKLSDEVNSGRYMGTVTDLKAKLKGAGVNLEAWGIPDNVGPAQAMQMMSQRFALEMRQEMPGPMSDGDRKFMEKGSISIENDPRANKIMAAWLKGSAERTQDRAKFAREYMRSAAFKNDPAGLDDYVDQKLAGKDYFDHSVLSTSSATPQTPANRPPISSFGREVPPQAAPPAQRPPLSSFGRGG